MDLISKIKRYLSLLAKTIMAAIYASKYLENGIYHIEKRHLLKGWGFPFFVVFSATKTEKLCTEAIFYWGEWTKKVVVVLEDIVISFYDKRGKIWNCNIEKRIDEISYPKVDYLAFDKKKRFNLAERCKGVQYTDKEHVVILAKDIIKNNGKQKIQYEFPYKQNEFLTKMGIDKFVSVLQHGDLNPYNAIWSTDKQYKYIDFDTIGEKPFLYDFFRMWLICFREEGLKKYIEGIFDGEIQDFFRDNDIQCENIDIEKDKYLAIFIVFSNQYWNTLGIDFGCLPETYTFTAEVIKYYQRFAVFCE